MGLIAISIILVLLPVLSIFLQYMFSLKQQTLKQFRQNVTVFYFDWIFVLFNAFWIYSISFDFQSFIILLAVSMVLNLIIHKIWFIGHTREKNESHMYSIKDKKILPAGVVHFIFSSVETSLIMYFIFFPLKSMIFYLNSLILFVFLILLLVGSKKIHGKITFYDALVAILGVIALILRLSLL